jgi:SAM-dependent methyltransferase
MTPHLEFSVLRERDQIDAAERELLSRGLVPPPQRPHERLVDRVLARAGRGDRAANLRPDAIKSWDVLGFVEAIAASAGPDDPVLDMGSVGCAILPALHRLGYRDLHGIDLNPQVRDMAHADAIDYVVGDLTRTPWPDGHFAAITSVSVIEHGVDDEALLSEVARLLRPGGVFLF